MKRIGILGGTFNPIHMGHLTIAEMVHEQFGLDKVLFIPSCLPPHKVRKNIVTAKNRYKMVQLAVQDNSKFEALDFEIKKPGKSYSIDTLRYLQNEYPPKTKFFFIVGGDLAAGLHTWKKIDDIFKIVTFIVVNRPKFEGVRASRRIKSIKVPGLHISSSDVRGRVKAEKTVRYLVPEQVRKYIHKNKLYIK